LKTGLVAWGLGSVLSVPSVVKTAFAPGPFISGIAPRNPWLNGLRVPFLLQFRRYALPFRAPVRTAHGLWTVREGVLVRLEDPSGRVGWGEAAPVPGFGTETAEEDARQLRGMGDRIVSVALDTVPPALGCLRRALTMAVSGMNPGGQPVPLAGETPFLPVVALLPAGKAALALVPARAEAGFRTFKWKVGVGDPADELVLLDDLCALLPDGARLRLDANGAWDRRTAERWLERCAERPVEFVEQPCFAPRASQAGAGITKQDDLLLGLAGSFPTPVALDESLAGDGDVERWIGAGWPGVFVVKPSLHGDLAGTLAQLEKARAAVVFSSALETAVGMQSALRTAFAWREPTAAKPLPLGFGVAPLFADSRFDGPVVAPFLYREDVERLNPEAVWNALS
jgi:O-succinylbenzoate synthase